MTFAHDINMRELQHPAEHLTDNYKKDESSNNFKLLDLSHREQQEIMHTLRMIEAWRDMDNAEGFTLDKIGKNVLELRQGRSDKEYRKAIKIKIRGNLSAGLMEDLNDICQILFEDNFMSVSETWHQAEYNFEPAAVAIHLHNLAIGEESTFWRDVAFISDIVKAGGVGLHAKQIEEYDVGEYDAAAESARIQEYIICDEGSLPTDVVDYCTVAGADWTQEYIIADSAPLPPNEIDNYDAAAANEFTKEEYTE